MLASGALQQQDPDLQRQSLSLLPPAGRATDTLQLVPAAQQAEEGRSLLLLMQMLGDVVGGLDMQHSVAALAAPQPAHYVGSSASAPPDASPVAWLVNTSQPQQQQQYHHTATTPPPPQEILQPSPAAAVALQRLMRDAATRGAAGSSGTASATGSGLMTGPLPAAYNSSSGSARLGAMQADPAAHQHRQIRYHWFTSGLDSLLAAATSAGDDIAAVGDGATAPIAPKLTVLPSPAVRTIKPLPPPPPAAAAAAAAAVAAAAASHVPFKGVAGGRTTRGSPSAQRPARQSSKTAVPHTSRFKGVTLHRRTGKYEAHVSVALVLMSRGLALGCVGLVDEHLVCQVKDRKLIAGWLEETHACTHHLP